MSVSLSLSDGGLEQRPTREIEIDVLVAHECASRSAVADLLWRRAGIRPPRGRVQVASQQPCGDGRVADVCVTASGGWQLLIEDKAAGGSFQKGQVENYERLATDQVRTVLIAPASFLSVHLREAKRFSAAVSLEEIAEALKSAPAQASPELAASYAHRRSEFLRCASASGWTGNPDDDVRAFGNCYRQLAEELTGGEIALTPKSLTNKAPRLVEFEKWAPHDNIKPFHKHRQGLVDVRIRDFTLGELQECLDSFGPQARCPKGWTAAAQDTGEFPVLRYRVRTISGPLSAEAFDDVQPILAEVLQALSQLKTWWARHAAKRLLRPPGWVRE